MDGIPPVVIPRLRCSRVSRESPSRLAVAGVRRLGTDRKSPIATTPNAGTNNRKLYRQINAPATSVATTGRTALPALPAAIVIPIAEPARSS